MHDARLITLDDSVELFNLALRTQLTDAEKHDLVAFLRVLERLVRAHDVLGGRAPLSPASRANDARSPMSQANVIDVTSQRLHLGGLDQRNRPARVAVEVPMDVPFTASHFPPLALGFFGLGAGYLIWGPQELFGFPRRDEPVDRSLGVWGVWMAGFCQLLTGLMLFIGLGWFQVFTTDPGLYMAALAFSAYGIHWFALGWNRYRGNDSRPNAGMSVAFTIISLLGVTVFLHAGDWPVGLLFIGLSGVYVTEFFVALGVRIFERVLGVIHVVTGLWLMYLMFATTLNFSAGFHLPV